MYSAKACLVVDPTPKACLMVDPTPKACLVVDPTPRDKVVGGSWQLRDSTQVKLVRTLTAVR